MTVRQALTEDRGLVGLPNPSQGVGEPHCHDSTQGDCRHSLELSRQDRSCWFSLPQCSNAQEQGWHSIRTTCTWMANESMRTDISTKAESRSLWDGTGAHSKGYWHGPSEKPVGCVWPSKVGSSLGGKGRSRPWQPGGARSPQRTRENSRHHGSELSNAAIVPQSNVVADTTRSEEGLDLVPGNAAGTATPPGIPVCHWSTGRTEGWGKQRGAAGLQSLCRAQRSEHRSICRFRSQPPRPPHTMRVSPCRQRAYPVSRECMWARVRSTTVRPGHTTGPQGYMKGQRG